MSCDTRLSLLFFLLQLSTQVRTARPNKSRQNNKPPKIQNGPNQRVRLQASPGGKVSHTSPSSSTHSAHCCRIHCPHPFLLPGMTTLRCPHPSPQHPTIPPAGDDLHLAALTNPLHPTPSPSYCRRLHCLMLLPLHGDACTSPRHLLTFRHYRPPPPTSIKLFCVACYLCICVLFACVLFSRDALSRLIFLLRSVLLTELSLYDWCPARKCLARAARDTGGTATRKCLVRAATADTSSVVGSASACWHLERFYLD